MRIAQPYTLPHEMMTETIVGEERLLLDHQKHCQSYDTQNVRYTDATWCDIADDLIKISELMFG